MWTWADGVLPELCEHVGWSSFSAFVFTPLDPLYSLVGSQQPLGIRSGSHSPAVPALHLCCVLHRPAVAHRAGGGVDQHHETAPEDPGHSGQHLLPAAAYSGPRWAPDWMEKPHPPGSSASAAPPTSHLSPTSAFPVCCSLLCLCDSSQ